MGYGEIIFVRYVWLCWNIFWLDGRVYFFNVFYGEQIGCFTIVFCPFAIS